MVTSISPPSNVSKKETNNGTSDRRDQDKAMDRKVAEEGPPSIYIYLSSLTEDEPRLSTSDIVGNDSDISTPGVKLVSTEGPLHPRVFLEMS